jgi:hypothetical protein
MFLSSLPISRISFRKRFLETKLSLIVENNRFLRLVLGLQTVKVYRNNLKQIQENKLILT